jgi:hypothetical protein
VRLQAEHQLERFVDGTKLAGAQPPGRISEVLDGSQLLVQDARRFARDLDFGPEGRGAALLDVGAITTVERTRNSSACTIAP